MTKITLLTLSLILLLVGCETPSNNSEPTSSDKASDSISTETKEDKKAAKAIAKIITQKTVQTDMPEKLQVNLDSNMFFAINNDTEKILDVYIPKRGDSAKTNYKGSLNNGEFLKLSVSIDTDSKTKILNLEMVDNARGFPNKIELFDDQSSCAGIETIFQEKAGIGTEDNLVIHGEDDIRDEEMGGSLINLSNIAVIISLENEKVYFNAKEKIDTKFKCRETRIDNHNGVIKDNNCTYSKSKDCTENIRKFCYSSFLMKDECKE